MVSIYNIKHQLESLLVQLVDASGGGGSEYVGVSSDTGNVRDEIQGYYGYTTTTIQLVC